MAARQRHAGERDSDNNTCDAEKLT
jgi:hypothetical protein